MNLVSTILIHFLLFGGILILPGHSVACEKSSQLDDFVKSPTCEWMSKGGSFLGVHIEDIDSEKAKNFDLKEEYGAHVIKVIEESAADKAGLKKDDVIRKWNGQRVESSAQLQRLVKETPVGRNVRLGLVRDGKEQTVEATMGEFSGQRHILKFMEPLKDLKFKESWKEYMEHIPDTLNEYFYHDDDENIIIKKHKLNDLEKKLKKP